MLGLPTTAVSIHISRVILTTIAFLSFFSHLQSRLDEPKKYAICQAFL